MGGGGGGGWVRDDDFSVVHLETPTDLVRIGGAVVTTAKLHVFADSGSQVALIVQGHASISTADLQQWREPDGTVLSLIDSTGRYVVGTTTVYGHALIISTDKMVVRKSVASGDLFSVENSASVPHFVVNNTGSAFFRKLTAFVPPLLVETGIGFAPEGDNNADLGVAATNRWRTGYFGTSVVVGGTVEITTTGVARNDGDLNLTGMSNIILTTGGSVRPDVNNARDLGHTTLARWRSGFFQTSVEIGSVVVNTSSITRTDAGNLTIDADSGDVILNASASVTLTPGTGDIVLNAAGSKFRPLLDNNLDLGTASVKFRTAYLGTSLRNADGSDTDPSYTFDSDPDTGVFRQAANALGMSVGGVEHARLSVPGSGDTALLIRYDPGTGATFQRVTVGVADSGGTGFRVLRVPN